MRKLFPTFLITAALSLVAVLLMITGQFSNEPRELVVDKAVTNTREAVAKATSVGGQPLATVKLPDQTEGKAIAGQLLVKITDPDDASTFGERIRPSGLPNTYILTVPAQADLNEQARFFSKFPGIEAVSPNYIVSKSVTPNDALYASNQWNLPKISAPAAWDRTTGNANTVIASLDTGINWNHQDVSAKVWTNTGEIPDNDIDDDNNGYVDDDRGMDFVNASFVGGDYLNDANGAIDDEGHGSLTASVFAGSTNNAIGVAGVNWQAKIMPVKVLDTYGFGSFTDVAAGIRYAADNGAKVINMSLGAFGVSSDFVTDDAINYAIGKKVVIVAASGNDGSSQTIDYPAINGNVIAVGATTSSDTRAGYSNGGSQLSVVAPGSGVPGVFAVMSQPSMNTPAAQNGSSTLTAGNYRYAVTAYNANGETVMSEPPSNNPNQNRVTIGSGQRASLSWPGVFGATGYKVYRTAVGGAQWSQKFLIDVGNSTSYTDDGSVVLSSTNPPAVNGALLNSDYATASGTSLATPHVAGLAGLLVGFNGTLTPAQVRAILQNSADKVPGMGGQNFTNLYGYGRINAQRAMNSLPEYSAQWAGQSAYPTVPSGDQTTVYIDYKNIGVQNWSSGGSNPVRLGTSHPRDRGSNFYTANWLSQNRPASFEGRVETGGSVTPTATITPGETARFGFTITALPVGSQTVFREYFQPVVEGIGWMEDYGVFLDVTVPPRTYQYTFAGQVEPPAVMQPGQTGAVSIDLTNTGTATWRRDGNFPFRLGTSHPRDRQSAFADNSWLSNGRIAFAGKVEPGGSVTDQATIAPGEKARFSFNMKAPSNQNGLLKEYFQPVVDGYAWLPDIGIHLQTFVPNVSASAPDYSYDYVSQSAYPSVIRTEQDTVNLRVRNTGKQTWSSTGANPVKLGTDRLRDRQAGFYTSGNWEAPNRIKLTHNITDPTKDVGGETTIAPGEIGEFLFTITGNPLPGAYNEYFTPVVEGITWMTDIGIYWRMTVREPLQVGLTQQSNATFSSTGPVTIKNDSGGTLGTVSPGQQIILSYDTQYHAVTPGGNYDSATPIHAEQPVDNVFTVSDLADNGSFNKFRGGLYLKNGSVGTWLVNDIDLELYLRCMGEVPDSWPMEAIKAQTVAARTYAARKKANPSNDVFALYDDTRDQVYNGYLSEAAKPNHITAVNATKGVIMNSSGQLIQAFYSSDSGGATEHNENVWGGLPISYLRGVADPYERPDIWSKTVANSTLQTNFGFGSNIDSIDILEYYPSGRVKTIKLTNSGGPTQTYTFPSDTNRTKLTTKSAKITGIGRSGNDWVFSGRGFGHGIGMGQWGAFNQANQGRNYQQILNFYYTGITFGSLY